jgi:hypothetical protein
VRRRLRAGPLVALLLLAGLGLWVALEERRPGAPEPAKDKQDHPLAFDRSELKAIRIRNEKGTIRLEKQGETWGLKEPLVSECDKDAVESLLSSLEVARVERVLGTMADLKSYGLDPGKTVLTIETVKGPPQTLVLGDGSAVGGTFFALLPDGKRVAVVGASLGEVAKKDLLSLRDKSLLALDPWKMKTLRIERGRETIVLEKPETGWKLVRPVEAPADGPTITDLLSALERLRATAFDAEKPTRKELKRDLLDPPSARITLRQEGWDVDKTVLFGHAKDGTLHARTVGRDPVVTVPKDFWEKIETKVFDLRRKEILGVGEYRIETLTATRPGAPAVILTRQKDGSWSLAGPSKGTVKADSMDLLLRNLGALKATAFEDATPETTRVALARRPALDLTLQEEAPASGGAGPSQHLVFGLDPKTRTVRARDMAWRPIAILPGASLESLTGTIDKLVKEAAESAKSAPAPGASPSAAPPSASSSPSPGH